jgi:hypothetical protein
MISLFFVDDNLSLKPRSSPEAREFIERHRTKPPTGYPPPLPPSTIRPLPRLEFSVAWAKSDVDTKRSTDTLWTEGERERKNAS